MKALVTGAEGFIGSHLVGHLLDAGDEVRAFVLYNSFDSSGWLDQLPEAQRRQVEVFPGDIRDAARLRDAMRGAEVVYHLAALISIPYSYQAASSFVSVNVLGTLEVLEAALKAEVGRLVMVSSSEVYGTARYVPMDEAHPLQPQSPYSASKIGAESLAMAFYHSYGLPVTVLRPFNAYGPRQSARAFIPAVITQLLMGAEALALGDLRPTRDFTYVQDTVRAMRMAAKAEATIGETLNVASGIEISMAALAEKLIEAIRPGTPVQQDEGRLRPDGSEVRRLLGAAGKIRSLCGWAPEWGLDDGLRETIAWFREGQHLAQYRRQLTHR